MEKSKKFVNSVTFSNKLCKLLRLALVILKEIPKPKKIQIISKNPKIQKSLKI